MPIYTVTDPTTKKTIELTGDKPPTEQELDEVFAKVGTGVTQAQGGGSRLAGDLPPVQAPKPSPLNLGERIGLSFADDKGRENYLRDKFKFVTRLPNGKFAAGNTIGDIAPIDPEGMFSDILGDLADITAIIPTIAGQIIGGTLGAAAGPGGVIAGGGIGSAIGEAISRGIGRIAGVDTRAASEQATDIAIAGAFGAVGEGIGQAFKFAGRGLSNLAKRSLDKAVKSTPNSSKTLQALAKIFKVTAAVPEDDLVVAGVYGFNRTLNMPYNNPRYGNVLATKLVNGVVRRTKALGKMVGVGDDWAKANFGSKSVELRRFGIKLLQDLSDPSVGIVDDIGRLNRGAFTEAADFRTMKQLTDLFFATNPRTQQLLPRNLKVGQLIDFKKRMSSSLRAYFKSGRVNKGAERGIAQYLDDITNSIARETAGTGLEGAANPYIRANKAFRSWKENLKLLKANGLDLEDMTELKSFIRNVDGEKILLSRKIGDFARKLEDKAFETRQAFDVVAKEIGVKFHGGGVGGSLGTLSDELNKFNAAQSFKKANPNLLRMGALAGMLGVSQYISPTSPEGLMFRAALGLSLGTPVGAKFLLKGGEKLKGKMGTEFLKKMLSGKPMSEKVLRAIITQAMADQKKGK